MSQHFYKLLVLIGYSYGLKCYVCKNCSKPVNATECSSNGYEKGNGCVTFTASGSQGRYLLIN